MNDLCSIPNSEVVASPELKAESPTSVATSWYPTESQGAALHKLHEVADVFSKTGDNRLAGLRPGCRRVLLVGSSGAGKTAVASQFATECGVPLLCIDGGSWVVTGSLKTSTLRVLRDFIRSCEDSVGIHGEALPGLQGVLYLDEVCKLLPDQESLSQNHWSLGVAAETIAVADADTRLLAHDWSPRDVQRLRANFILVAGGAFASAMIQARQSAQRGSLGFGTPAEMETYSSKIKQFLPEEILSRFSTVITLEAPTRHDLEQAIERIHSQLGVKRQQSLRELVDEAHGSAGGVRWLENYLFRLLSQHPYAIRSGQGLEPQAKVAPKQRSFDLLVSDVPRCLAQANETAAKLSVKLGLLYSRLHFISDQGTGIPLCGVLSDPAFGEALLGAIHCCQLCSEISGDDREELKPLVRWRAMAWQGLGESSSDLEKHKLTEFWAEAWALSGTLIDYRLKLSQAVKRGLIA